MTRLFLLILIIGAVLTHPATAHDSRPLFIAVEETGDGRVALSWSAPSSIARQNIPVVALDEADCVIERAPASEGYRRRAHYRCEVDAPRTLTIAYPQFNPSIATLVRIVFPTGETRTASLPPDIDRWTAPRGENFVNTAQSYFTLGGRHIFGGVDHLLFIAGLGMIAATLKRLALTVTGFTIAHSVTLALTALGLLRLSVPAIEATIALSIVFLAVEIARNDRTTLAWRRPALVAAVFGLAHGAGFASALAEVGLPQRDAAAALLFFNLGVEAGQIAVIMAGAFIVAGLRRLAPAALSPAAQKAIAYAIGVAASYWLFERVTGALAGAA